MAGRYHTETFENIPVEKRERILRAAAKVLGRDGVAGARMGDIAAEAGISHGSLFTYFPTKDDLIRAIVERGVAMERERFMEAEAGPFGEAIVGVFSRAWETASAEGELISLWLSFSLRENDRFSDDILPLEADASERWSRMAERGVKEGVVSPDLDLRVVQFLLDASVAQLMKSRASELERKKFALLFDDPDEAPLRIARTLSNLFRKDR
jgi:TetR/AcrR family transcriptional regulator